MPKVIAMSHSLGNCEQCERVTKVFWFIGGPFTEIEPWTQRFPRSPVQLCEPCGDEWKARKLEAYNVPDMKG